MDEGRSSGFGFLVQKWKARGLVVVDKKGIPFNPDLSGLRREVLGSNTNP